MKESKFGKRIRELREGGRMYLKDLADKMGWSVVYQSELERGKRVAPSRKKVLKLADALGIDPRELLSLADQDKGLVELELTNKGPAQTNVALTLARSWDSLSEGSMEKVLAIINEESSRDVEE